MVVHVNHSPSAVSGMNATNGDAARRDDGGRPRRPWRAGVLAAGAAGIAMFAAACGGGLASSAGSLGRSNLQIAISYANCMRSHGITSFPDPTVNASGVTIDPHGLDTSSAQFHAAQQACRKYMTEAGKYMPPG